jgi:hypothetical protein
MAGSVDEQFKNLLQTLHTITTDKLTPSAVGEWLRTTFDLSPSFARDVYTVLFISSGLVTVHNGTCRLTSDGQTVLLTASPIILLEVFEKTFAGVTAFLEVLRNKPYIKSGVLNSLWFETVKERFPKMRNWSKRTLGNQCRHRIDWLRTMGFITSEKGVYSLSESGWRFVQETPPESIAIQRHEIKKQEKELDELALGVFQPFDSSLTKTSSLRQTFVRDRAFRQIVTTQYDYYCAVCGFRLETPRGIHEAEAAHIIPKRRRGTDDPRNGVCLCGICHWLFDEGIISVHAESLSVLVASYLGKVEKADSVQRVLGYQNKRIRSVANPIHAPAIEALQWHNEYIFLG